MESPKTSTKGIQKKHYWLEKVIHKWYIYKPLFVLENETGNIL